MDYTAVGAVIFANLLPASEQFSGIATALYLGFSPIQAFAISVITNTIIFIPVYLALVFFYDSFFSKIGFFTRYLEKTRKMGKTHIEKYGVLGLTVLLSLPGPFTGTYTATALSWLVGMDWKKAMFAVFIGSAIGGLVILAGMLGLISAAKYVFSGLF